VLGVGQKAAEWIVGERSHGEFLSRDDFRTRIPPRVVNKLIFSRLVGIGAFNRLPESDFLPEEVPF